jgi:hypothetical protein
MSLRITGVGHQGYPARGEKFQQSLASAGFLDLQHQALGLSLFVEGDYKRPSLEEIWAMLW